MFDVGDKVVYPMHGAGVIESIEVKEVFGRRQKFYIMRLPMGNLRVMIPTDGSEECGLRSVIDENELKDVLQILQGERTRMSNNWNRRYRANLEKLKSGDIYEVAEVVRNLTLRDKEKKLSTGERKMLESARLILVSELALVANVGEEQALVTIEDAVNSSLCIEDELFEES
jgi:CarD family transcriptional regulator